MSTPDFTQETLDFIRTNWDTSNYSPKPVPIDRRDSRRLDTGERGVTFDLTEGNAVGVAPVSTTYTPEGLGWHAERAESTVSIRAEGLHSHDHGDVADASDFRAFVDEVKRTLKVERKRPLPGYWRLNVREENEFSPENHDYFRVDLSAEYVGLEDLTGL